GTSIFGIAAFAQPAIGRLYLSGQTQTARDVYYDAAQGTPMVVVALVFIVLLVASFIVFGVAFARLELMPRWAGIGYAVSGPLFAVIGFALDNWIQSVAAILMTASAVWMVIALRRFEYRRTSQGRMEHAQVTPGGSRARDDDRRGRRLPRSDQSRRLGSRRPPAPGLSHHPHQPFRGHALWRARLSLAARRAREDRYRRRFPARRRRTRDRATGSVYRRQGVVASARHQVRRGATHR